MAGVRVAPAGMSVAATTLRRATRAASCSSGRGCFTPSPSIAAMRRMPRTIAPNSAGSSEAAWSGPGSVRSSVRCFSMIVAPRLTAASDASMPRLWSE